MKKIILILTLILAIANTVFAQKSEVIVVRPLNSFNFNFRGDGSYWSVYYERLFMINNNMFIAGKAGLGYSYRLVNDYYDGNQVETMMTIPHHATLNIGKGKHFAEFGFGGTITDFNKKDSYITYPIVGYRIQPLLGEKYNFRIYGSFPVYGWIPADVSFYSFGMSLGICF